MLGLDSIAIFLFGNMSGLVLDEKHNWSPSPKRASDDKIQIILDSNADTRCP